MAIFNIAYLFILLAVCVHSRRWNINPGQRCKTTQRDIGVCRALNECPSAKASGIKPRSCQNPPSVTNPIICCREAPMAITLTTTTEKQTLSNFPGYKTFKKCDEYSRWLPPSFADFSSSVQGRQGKCGISSTNFILGGTAADPLEFPHMAHIGEVVSEGSHSWTCGGSLISERFVLTAAHCISRQYPMVVGLGWSDQFSYELVEVEEIISHPGYNRTSSYNDIALLKLKTDVIFTDFKRPACLQIAKNFQSPNGTASGWGKTENALFSDKLLKVDLPIVDFDACKQHYKPNLYKIEKGVNDTIQLCAGGYMTNRDTCGGDSGGPIQIVLQKPYCMYSIVGITSIGIKCGFVPGVYTRVSAYIPWIEQTVWSNATFTE